MGAGKKIALLLLLFLLAEICCCHGTKLSETLNKADGSRSLSEENSPPVTFQIYGQQVIVDNGIVKLTLSIPEGHVIGINYGGIDNVLDFHNPEHNRGYWDIFWGEGREDWLHMKNFKVIRADENQVELSFSTDWDGSSETIPLNIDKRFVVLRGSSGFYNYLVLDHERGWPAAHITQMRAAYKPRKDKFHYMVISDDIQKIMPSGQDVEKGKRLAYREAVAWRNHTDPKLRTQVEDKYQYSQDMKDQGVHGWISSDPYVGFWLIKPSTEFHSAGPFKQELTSHLGPTSLVTFLSGHYAGSGFHISLQQGDAWTKVLGPYSVYLNSVSENQKDRRKQLWNMAKGQLQSETAKWPYDFPSSEAYQKSNQRGVVQGQLFVRDHGRTLVPAKSAWVGLAAPGEEGSWQMDAKNYQFWTKADDNGNFNIKGVHSGQYNLYAWVPGYIGDYKYNQDIIVNPGSVTNLDEVVYQPPRSGPTVWEIGVPDRSAAEFFVPDPLPDLINPVFLSDEKNKFRQYGLWDRYTDLYPDQDLVYTVGVSDYRKDWFYAHVPRRTNEKSYEPSTWQIRFTLQNVNPLGRYTLRIALASASAARVQVGINNYNSRFRTGFTTKTTGRDNAIARHGIHGFHYLFNVDVPGYLLHNGMNTLYLRQSVAQNQFCGVMYDYLRLEGPSSYN